jgi:hypothetical protein
MSEKDPSAYDSEIDAVSGVSKKKSKLENLSQRTTPFSVKSSAHNQP